MWDRSSFRLWNEGLVSDMSTPAQGLFHFPAQKIFGGIELLALAVAEPAFMRRSGIDAAGCCTPLKKAGVMISVPSIVTIPDGP